MSELPISEIRRPDGTVMVRWVGDAIWTPGWPPPVGPLELWQDGELMGRIWEKETLEPPTEEPLP